MNLLLWSPLLKNRNSLFNKYGTCIGSLRTILLVLQLEVSLVTVAVVDTLRVNVASRMNSVVSVGRRDTFSEFVALDNISSNAGSNHQIPQWKHDRSLWKKLLL